MNNTLPLYGFGTFHLARNSFKGVQLEKAEKTLRYALSAGVGFYDTSPVYGFGTAETILGKAVKGFRDRIWIATKCGLKNENGRIHHDLSYDSILNECESSLKRMDISHIDLYQIHWPDPATPIEESCRALYRLLNDGLIRHIGVSNFKSDLLEKISRLIPLYSVQNHFSILKQEDAEDVIPWCARNNIKYIAYNVLEQGLLTCSMNTDYIVGKKDLRKLNPLFSNREIFREMLSIRDSLSENPLVEALRFVLQNRTISTILISTSDISHLKKNLLLVQNMRTNRTDGLSNSLMNQ